MHIKSKDSWLKHFDFILIDLFVYYISFILSNLIYLGSLDRYPRDLMVMVFLCISMPCLIIDLTYSPFSGVLRRDSITEIRIGFEYTFYNMVFSIILLYIFKIGGIFSRFAFVLTYMIFLVLIIIARILWKKFIFKNKISFFPNTNNTLLIVSYRKDIEKVLENINKEEYQQYEIKGLCILDKANKDYGYAISCSKENLVECVEQNNIGEVYIAANPNVLDSQTINRLIEDGVGIHLDINKIYDLETDDQRIDRVGIYKTLGLGIYSFTPRQSLYLIVKRTFDLIVSFLLLFPLGIISLIVKLAYVLTGDHDPIFYKQVRVGQYGELFDLYKFRTMVSNADEILKELLKDQDNQKEWNEYHKLKNDPRITKLGNILRKSSLDEIPQFINVLKGDMSIVGPRPLVEGELKMHNGLRLYERIKPGITGWWACNGRSNISYDERLEMEYYYVKNCSFILDVFTIFRTFYVVIKKTGAE